MGTKDTVSHFWIAGQPFFSSTILVAPPCVGAASISAALDGNSSESEGGLRTHESVECTVYDVDGVKVNSVSVEFPAGTVGVIELGPYTSALKLEGGLQHGHVQVVSRAGTKHSCRIVGEHNALLVGEPILLRSRDSSFLPITLSTQREQLLVAVNAGTESAQLSCRLFYGSRSPEWNIIVPPNGSKLVSVHDDLLASQDDRSWEKSAMQAYLRITSRYQGPVSCFGIERIPGETLERDVYRTLALS